MVCLLSNKSVHYYLVGFLPLSTNCYRCICRLYLYNVPQNLIWLDTITDLGSLRFQWNFQAWSSLGRVVWCLWCQVLQKSLALFCCTCRFPAAWICLKVLGQCLWLGVCLQVQQTPFLQPLVGYCVRGSTHTKSRLLNFYTSSALIKKQNIASYDSQAYSAYYNMAYLVIA